MYSLFNALTDQHGAELEPVRCNRQTVKRLVAYFHELVTGSGNAVLALEGRCPDGDSSRDSIRMQKLADDARHLFLFTCDRHCRHRTWDPGRLVNMTVLAEPEYHALETGPFIVVVEPRFCGLLSCKEMARTAGAESETYAVVWTFDPNVVYTAIEYLLARMGSQRPDERIGLQMLLNSMTMHSPSLQVALKFTTHLAILMQRQSELDTAASRISSSISSTLDLEFILKNAVEEVGRALNARRAALVLWQEGTHLPEGISVYEREGDSVSREVRERTALESLPAAVEPAGVVRAVRPLRPFSAESALQSAVLRGLVKLPGSLEVPLTYRNGIIGVLVVEDDAPNREWEDEEVLMVRTVADQLAIAISHSRLVRVAQTQAITDALTGLYNHHYFQEQLDRELKLADRNNDPVSLILLDVDLLKRINDTLGRPAGDAALCHVAFVMRSVVRDIDICARYGGEEFVILLPQCGRENAMSVAERVREAIAIKPAPKVGRVTASIGVATYPTIANTKEDLLEMADRAMSRAKEAGRNKVRWSTHRASDGLSV
jgi:diguanylate cyclase (GGDEF)-like protein